MATVAKGYDLDYAWRAAARPTGGRALSRGHRGGGAARHLVGPGAERLGFAAAGGAGAGQRVNARVYVNPVGAAR